MKSSNVIRAFGGNPPQPPTLCDRLRLNATVFRAFNAPEAAETCDEAIAEVQLLEKLTPELRKLAALLGKKSFDQATLEGVVKEACRRLSSSEA